MPDRICAWLLEALWTCTLHGAGVEVFGNWPGDLCPASVWVERPPFWDQNTPRAVAAATNNQLAHAKANPEGATA